MISVAPPPQFVQVWKYPVNTPSLYGAMPPSVHEVPIPIELRTAIGSGLNGWAS